MYLFLSILNSPITDQLIYFINVVIRCILVATLLYEINGTVINKKRTVLYALLMMLTITVPLMPYFKLPLIHPIVDHVFQYALVQLRNPLWMILCYVITIKVLKLPWQSVTNLLMVIFCTYQLQVCLAAVVEILLGCILALLQLIPNLGNFDLYLLMSSNIVEEIATTINTLLLITAWHFIRRYIKANPHKVKMFAEEHNRKPIKTIITSFLQITILWLITLAGIFTRSVDSNYIIIAQAGYAIAMTLVYVLFIYLNYYLKLRNIQTRYLTQSNKMMLDTIDNFRGIKHDFVNILQTYDGYFALEDFAGLKEYHQVLRGKTIFAGERLNFQTTFNEQPAILGLFSNTIEYAGQWDVHFDFLHTELLNSVALPEFDLCRILSILFNNAIEHAAQTQTKVVSFSAQFQFQFNKCIIIIANSVNKQIISADLFKDGYTTKEGHSGHGLAEVNKILAEYYGCTIMANCTDDTFSIYLNTPIDN